MYHHIYPSPAGDITAVFEGGYLLGLSFVGQRHIIPSGGTEYRESSAEIDLLGEWLKIYFDGREPDFTPKIKLLGTDFRLMIWETLLSVPYGATVSYGELSRMAEERFGRRFFPRAVGGAVGHNPISVIVPCHRVIGGDGRLVGYDGGVNIKKLLLKLEGRER